MVSSRPRVPTRCAQTLTRSITPARWDGCRTRSASSRNNTLTSTNEGDTCEPNSQQGHHGCRIAGGDRQRSGGRRCARRRRSAHPGLGGLGQRPYHIFPVAEATPLLHPGDVLRRERARLHHHGRDPGPGQLDGCLLQRRLAEDLPGLAVQPVQRHQRRCPRAATSSASSSGRPPSRPGRSPGSACRTSRSCATRRRTRKVFLPGYTLTFNRQTVSGGIRTVTAIYVQSFLQNLSVGVSRC